MDLLRLLYTNVAQATFLSRACSQSVPLTRGSASGSGQRVLLSAPLGLPSFRQYRQTDEDRSPHSHSKIAFLTSYRPAWRPTTPRVKLVSRVFGRRRINSKTLDHQQEQQQQQQQALPPRPSTPFDALFSPHNEPPYVLPAPFNKQPTMKKAQQQQT